jgi:hypothetical protein
MKIQGASSMMSSWTLASSCCLLVHVELALCGLDEAVHLQVQIGHAVGPDRRHGGTVEEADEDALGLLKL